MAIGPGGRSRFCPAGCADAYSTETSSSAADMPLCTCVHVSVGEQGDHRVRPVKRGRAAVGGCLARRMYPASR